uniref:Uncharacterized protein n=1 Tax=Kalanchoe fedtschenkoi TaxID=63787 RepID=A0A7N0U3J0_KALFE
MKKSNSVTPAIRVVPGKWLETDARPLLFAGPLALCCVIGQVSASLPSRHTWVNKSGR